MVLTAPMVLILMDPMVLTVHIAVQVAVVVVAVVEAVEVVVAAVDVAEAVNRNKNSR
ncbi:unnamed protein product [Meloidogyne enterolobii]|uniref:Uncharacterized protein n=1 Tax=Meloidogyne enterolobii TaxID=390850 RepID=A0ACB0ZQ11_MELEN